MKKNITIGFLTLFLLANSAAALAQEVSPSVEPTSKVEDRRRAVLDEMKATGTQVRTDLKATGTQLRTELKATGTQVRTEMQTKRAETKEEMAAKREEFKKKIEEMKDTKKKEGVERIDEKINNLNEKHTVRLSGFIENVMRVLTNLQKRADALKAKGVDTTSINTMITDAETALKDAQTAVDAQAAKSYTMDITDEATVKTSAQDLLTQFRTDLKALHEVVKAAHLKVVEIAREIAKLQKTNMPTGGAEEETEPTKSVTKTPSPTEVETTPSVSPTAEPAL